MPVETFNTVKLFHPKTGKPTVVREGDEKALLELGYAEKAPGKKVKAAKAEDAGEAAPKKGRKGRKAAKAESDPASDAAPADSEAPKDGEAEKA